MARVRARTFLLLVPFRRFLDGRAVLELLACAMLSEVAIRALTWSLLIEQGSALDRSAARQLLVPVVYFAFGSAGTQAPLSMDARGCAHALRAKGRGRGRGSVKQGGRGGPTSSRTWARRAVGRSSRWVRVRIRIRKEWVRVRMRIRMTFYILFFHEALLPVRSCRGQSGNGNKNKNDSAQSKNKIGRENRISLFFFFTRRFYQ